MTERLDMSQEKHYDKNKVDNKHKETFADKVVTFGAKGLIIYLILCVAAYIVFIPIAIMLDLGLGGSITVITAITIIYIWMRYDLPGGGDDAHSSDPTGSGY